MIIQSKNVWIDETFKEAQIELEGQKIKGIYPYGEKEVDEDYDSLRIIPGLIDVHCHGFNGMDSNYATVEGFEHWIKTLPSEGVTSFLAATSTAPEENLLASQALIAELIENPRDGANLIGIHVEGPQINHDYRGAHNPYWIQKPNIEQFQRYQKAAKGHVMMICIACEQDDNFELTKYCVANRVRVVIGHTASKYQDCLNASAAGATSFTHTFNAMVGLHHREPGTVGAAMSMDNMYAELICDGVHVHFAAAKIVIRAKDKDKLILITDSVQIKGLKPGIYESPGRWVQIGEDGCGRLKDGRLAGSSNKLITMLKNAVVSCDAPLVKAINAATINPARFLGIDDNKGLIKEGYDADIIVIDDDYEVKQAYVLANKKL